MLYLLFCSTVCFAHIAVLVVNAAVIRAITKYLGDTEKGYRTALLTSFIEILLLGTFNLFLLGPLLFFFLSNEDLPDSPSDIGNDFVLYEKPVIIGYEVLVVILMMTILTLLIWWLYQFKVSKALKAAALIIGVDFMLAVSAVLVVIVLRLAISMFNSYFIF